MALESVPQETTESPVQNKCYLSLEWRTPYACPICEEVDYIEQETACDGGYVVRHIVIACSS
jgi:hypothetical protein